MKKKCDHSHSNMELTRRETMGDLRMRSGTAESDTNPYSYVTHHAVRIHSDPHRLAPVEGKHEYEVEIETPPPGNHGNTCSNESNEYWQPQIHLASSDSPST